MTKTSPNDVSGVVWVLGSDGHGFPDPRGSVGMGVVGMGVGDYFFTHAKPTPIAVGVVGSHSYGCMGLMVGFLHKI
jgi:hypothetical protein